MEIPILSYVLRQLCSALIFLYSLIMSKKTSDTATVYKGIRPCPPKVVAVVWAEETVKCSAVRQLADIIGWCKQDHLEDVLLYDPLGELKTRAEEFRCELGSNYSIEVGWSRRALRRSIICESCRLHGANAQPQSAAAAARSVIPSATHLPAAAEGRPARLCTSLETDDNMTIQERSSESNSMPAPGGDGTDRPLCDCIDRPAGDGTDRPPGDCTDQLASLVADSPMGTPKDTKPTTQPCAEGVSGCQAPCCQLSQPSTPSINDPKGRPEPTAAETSCNQTGIYPASPGLTNGPHSLSGDSNGNGAAPSGVFDAVPMCDHVGITATQTVEGVLLGYSPTQQSPHVDGMLTSCGVCEGLAEASSRLHQVKSMATDGAQGGLRVTVAQHVDGRTNSCERGEPPASVARPEAPDANQCWRQGITVRILSGEDGYAPVLLAASTGGVCGCCGARVPLKAPDYRKSLARLRQQMADVAGPAVLVQPELILVVGPVLTLAGFPPLHAATPEILHIGPSQRLCSEQVDAAMAKFLRTEQRFGK